MKCIEITSASLVIKKSFCTLKIDRALISRIVTNEGVGMLDIYLSDKSAMSSSPLNFSLLTTFIMLPHVIYFPKEQKLQVDVFGLDNALDSKTYYQFLQSLKAEFSNCRDAKELGMINDKQTQINTFCSNCSKDFSYNLKRLLPFLVSCPYCDTLHLDALCLKCGMGGLVIENSLDSSKSPVNLGKVMNLDWHGVVGTSFENHPRSWLCQKCNNEWMIPESIYTVSPEQGDKV